MSMVGVLPRLNADTPLMAPRLWPIKEDVLDSHRTSQSSLISSRSSMPPSVPPPPGQGIGVARSNLATALFQAVVSCRASKVKFLLGSGHVPANIRNDQGHNLLMTALFVDDDKRRDQIFRYLLRHGVDFSYRHQSSGRDVLAMACSMGRTDQVRSILEVGMGEIDVQRRDCEGLTPLHLAVKGGHEEIVRILMKIMDKYRLSVDVVDNHGLTPYMYARRLGRPDIARTLVEEGNACIYRRDDQTFRSADDWAVIGAKENVLRQKIELRRQVAYYRIRGMLPPINELREMKNTPPKITLNSDDSGDAEGDKSSSVNTPDGSQSSSDTPVHSNRKGSKGSSNELFVPSQKFGKSTPRDRRVGSLMALNDHIRQISAPKNSVLNKSVDTAFTLLGLKAEDNMEHATNFVQSELDTTKAKEYSSAGPPGLNAMDQLTEMMQALSDQQSSAFRKVAVPPLTPPKATPKKKKKKNVSTLAILMAKERRQKAMGRARPGYKAMMPVSGGKPGKTLAEHARDRRKARPQQAQDARQAIKRKAPEADA